MSVDLIRAKQKELAEAEAAKIAARKAREEQTRQAFIDTGIPAMWEELKNTVIPHWRRNSSREDPDRKIQGPLNDHAKKNTDTALHLYDWDGELKIGWSVEMSDKGAVTYVRRERTAVTSTWHAPESLRDDFVNYMARFLPPLGDSNGNDT